MFNSTAKKKIRTSETQNEGIEYPNKEVIVTMTSVRRPRLQPDTRPRTMPSHIVTTVASPTSTRVVVSRGPSTPTTEMPARYGLYVPRFPCTLVHQTM